MKNKNLLGLSLMVAGFLAGCTEYPENITPAYVPSIVYKGANCQELFHEQQKLADHVAQLTQAQRDAANDDTVAIVGAVIIGWPTLLALPLSRDQSAQLAIAHGHYEAVDDAMHLRGCRAGHRKGPGAGSTWLSPRSPVGYSGNTAQWKRHRGDFPPL